MKFTIDVFADRFVRSVHDGLSMDISDTSSRAYKDRQPHINTITLPKMPEPKVCWLDERRRGTLQLFNQRR